MKVGVIGAGSFGTALAQTIAQMMTEMPEGTTESQVKQAFLRKTYAEQLQMSDAILDGVMASLTEENVDTAMRNVLKTQYVSLGLYETAGDAKVAAVFDKYIASCDDNALLALFEEYINKNKSESSREQNLTLLGVADMADPFTINIYASTFEAKDSIADIIAKYNDAAEEKDDIKYTDLVAVLMSSISTVINAISYVLIAFVSISLIVSSIMIGIITYISVLERTKEIGILRSVGASKRDVSRIFNAETIIEGFVSGVMGILITLILCFISNPIIQKVTEIPEFSTQLPVEGALILIGISVVLSVVAGLFPARMAAKKDPVVALRSE